MIWPLSYLFDERHGSYSVRKVNGKSVLFQRVKAPKSLTSVSLCPQQNLGKGVRVSDGAAQQKAEGALVPVGRRQGSHQRS